MIPEFTTLFYYLFYIIYIGKRDLALDRYGNLKYINCQSLNINE